MTLLSLTVSKVGDYAVVLPSENSLKELETRTNILYRFERSCGNIHCYVFPITRTTPKGVWVRAWDKEKFINNNWKKRFAHTTPADALLAFIHRKMKQIEILTKQLDDAKEQLRVSQEYLQTHQERLP